MKNVRACGISTCNVTNVVVENENNEAIIVDIASPWDHTVYEMEGEKIEKYQDLKREAGAKAFHLHNTSNNKRFTAVSPLT